ncbi:hypothetical protein GJR88_02272 [Dietzia sp. DQ12-45-1b]|nr:hypothetical protein GJR88_02272 [Dietzia sp. DQ12-45-1b]
MTGCATTSDTESPEVTAPTTSETQSGPIELDLGETANLVLGANGPRDIDVTVTDITVSDQCRYGVVDYGGEPGWSGQTDGYFIEVSGEIDVRESPDSFSIPQWVAADHERNIIEVLPAYECAEAEVAGVQTFIDSVLPGTTARAMEEYWVDTLPAEWFLDEPYEDHAFVWPVPESKVAEQTTEPAPEAAPAYTAPAAAPAAPTFVECYLADGTALMSDGTTTYLDTCNESAGGPYLLEDGSPAITYSPEDLADASYWSDCIEAGNTAEYCNANSPY